MTMTAIHPGKHFAEELKELNVCAAALARRLKIPTNGITGISCSGADGSKEIT